jgi:hypothetical protein
MKRHKFRGVITVVATVTTLLAVFGASLAGGTAANAGTLDSVHGSISGTIYFGSTLTPASGFFNPADLYYQHFDDATSSWGALQSGVRVDNYGKYLLSGLDPGMYRVLAKNSASGYYYPTGPSHFADGYWSTTLGGGAPGDISVVAGEALTGYDVLLGMSPVVGMQIRGTVSVPKGDGIWAPLRDAFVVAHKVGSTDLFTANTDSDGTYAFSGLSAGSYQLHFSYENSNDSNNWADQWLGNTTFQSESATVPASANSSLSGVDFRFVPGSSISGTVSFANPYHADTSKGVVVRVWAYAKDPVTSQMVLISGASTDSHGGYAIASLPLGAYVLQYIDQVTTPYVGQGHYPDQYWDRAFSFAEATPITVTSAQGLTHADMVLSAAAPFNQGGSISLAIVAGDSQSAIQNAHVVVSHALPSGVGATVVSGFTDATGHLMIANLDPGSYRIQIDGTGYATEYWNDLQDQTSSDTVTVTAGATTGPLQVWLTVDGGSSDFFQDVPPANLFYADIEWMGTTGRSLGTAVTYLRPLYKPNDAVSRQAMASFLFRLEGGAFVPPVTPHFADVPAGSQFYTAIEWMYANGISTGTAQSSGLPLYKPLDPVSRQAMALFLTRIDLPPLVLPAVPAFADVDQSNPNYAAIEWMFQNGISTGTAQESGLPLYKPLDPVSRQAMAAFLHRFSNLPHPAS